MWGTYVGSDESGRVLLFRLMGLDGFISGLIEFTFFMELTKFTLDFGLETLRSILSVHCPE